MTVAYLPEVPLGVIVPHGKNPRRELRDIEQLAASIKAQGVLEPLLLAPLNGTQYRLIAGHRRLAAAKKAGLASVPARVDEDLDTPDKQVLAMISENTQRNDLTVLEEGDAYQGLLDLGWTPARVAKATGRAAKTVKARLSVAGLPEATRKRIDAGQIPLDDAVVLAEFAGAPEYADLARWAGTGNFAWAVDRARGAAAARAALGVVQQHCEEKGWDVAPVRPAHCHSVMSSWSVPQDVPGALAELLDAPHVLVVEGKDRGVWHLVRPYDVDGDQDEDDDESPGYVEDPEVAARRLAAEERAAGIGSAQKVRADWLHGRMDKLLVKDHERVLLLRLLVDDWIRNGDFAGGVVEFLDMPAAPEGAREWDDEVIAARRAWAAGLSEMQAWKALIALTFDVIRCGSTWEDSHVPSINVAVALGYEPSDIELDLITPTTSEEPTA